jgi:hypothetical protein
MPEITYELSGSNKWERIYYQQHQGNSENKKIRAPLIEPFELPILFDRYVLAVQTFCSAAKPSWRSAGHLTQVFGNLNLENTSPIGGSPGTAVDAATFWIRLNTTQLIVFPKLSPDYYLWFDPAPWLPSLAFGVWQFVGESHDEVVELIETVKVDVLRVESKLDAMN